VRRCSRCGELRAVAEFAVDRTKASGHKSICRPCDNAKSKRCYREHRERKLAAAIERAARLRAQAGPRLCACGAPTRHPRSRYCEECRLQAEVRRHGAGWAKLGEDERERRRALERAAWTVRNRRCDRRRSGPA
jgi:hypothetical protein